MSTIHWADKKLLHFNRNIEKVKKDNFNVQTTTANSVHKHIYNLEMTVQILQLCIRTKKWL